MAEHLLDNVWMVGGGSITCESDGQSLLFIDPENKEHKLFDCGSPPGAGNLLRELKALQIDIGKVAIYASHIHADHIAAAPFFPDAPVYVHEDGIDAIEKTDLGRAAMFLYQEFSFPDLSYAQPIKDGHQVSVGKNTIIFRHAPGHAEELMYAKVITKEGVILAASDLLWGAFSKRMGSDYNKWSDSLDALAQDKFDYVTFGHNVSRLIPNAMQHIDHARSVFCKDIQPQDGGLLEDPWAAVWHNQQPLSKNYVRLTTKPKPAPRV